jgi:alkylation response protein AidB-like acyl-CoA dehydrogenase
MNAATAVQASGEPAAPRPAPLTRLPEEERLFQQAVREFAEREVRPRVAAMDRSGELPPAVVDGLFALGAMGIQVPARWGGAGASFFSAITAIEELARVDPSVSVFVDVQNALVAAALLRWGDEAQKERWLPALCRDTVGAYALSETEAGSDAFALATSARPDGDGFVVTGRKAWTTNAAEAGLFLVFAKVPTRRQPLVTAFLVERDAPGVEVGPRIEKLGIRASSTCELVLEEVRVPRRNVLGEVGGGYEVALDTLNKGRVGIGAQMVGLAQGAFEAALAYAQQRKQFGQPIASFQGVHFPLADMAARIETARLAVYNAARLVDATRFYLHLTRPAAIAKYVAAEVAQDVASRALEVFGGFGFASECPAEKFYRDVKIGQIYEGTANIQLRTIAGTLVDGLR